MLYLLILLLIFLLIIALLVGVGVGIGFLLRWLVPGMDLGLGSLIGVIAAATSSFFLARLLSIPTDPILDAGDEETEAPPFTLMPLPPPPTRRRRPRKP